MSAVQFILISIALLYAPTAKSEPDWQLTIRQTPSQGLQDLLEVAEARFFGRTVSQARSFEPAQNRTRHQDPDGAFDTEKLRGFSLRFSRSDTLWEKGEYKVFWHAGAEAGILSLDLPNGFRLSDGLTLPDAIAVDTFRAAFDIGVGLQKVWHVKQRCPWVGDIGIGIIQSYSRASIQSAILDIAVDNWRTDASVTTRLSKRFGPACSGSAFVSLQYWTDETLHPHFGFEWRF